MVILKALLTPSAQFNVLRPFQSLKASLLLAALEAKESRTQVLSILAHNRIEYQKGVFLALLASLSVLALGFLVLPSIQSELVGVSCVTLLYGLFLQLKVNWIAYQQRLLCPMQIDYAFKEAGPRSSVKYFLRRCIEEEGQILRAEFSAAMLLYKQGRIWEPGKVKLSRKGLVA